MIATKEKLAQVLHARGLFDLERRARAAEYDDFESGSVTPIGDLVAALRQTGDEDLAKRAMEGEWDGTAEESEAWAASPEGREMIRGLVKK